MNKKNQTKEFIIMKKIISFQIEEELLKIIEKEVKENYRTLSSQLRLMIDEYVENHHLNKDE